MSGVHLKNLDDNFHSFRFGESRWKVEFFGVFIGVTWWWRPLTETSSYFFLLPLYLEFHLRYYTHTHTLHSWSWKITDYIEQCRGSLNSFSRFFLFSLIPILFFKFHFSYRDWYRLRERLLEEGVNVFTEVFLLSFWLIRWFDWGDGLARTFIVSVLLMLQGVEVAGNFV